MIQPCFVALFASGSGRGVINQFDHLPTNQIGNLNRHGNWFCAPAIYKEAPHCRGLGGSTPPLVTPHESSAPVSGNGTTAEHEIRGPSGPRLSRLPSKVPDRFTIGSTDQTIVKNKAVYAREEGDPKGRRTQDRDKPG